MMPDAATLAAAARLQYRITASGPGVLVAEYRRALAEDPGEAARLVEAGRADYRHACEVTALIVCTLAAAQAEGAKDAA